MYMRFINIVKIQSFICINCKGTNLLIYDEFYDVISVYLELFDVQIKQKGFVSQELSIVYNYGFIGQPLEGPWGG